MVANIIARWAPPAENDTKAYIRTMLMLTGIGGQEKLLLPDNVESYRKLSKLLAAMTVMENGIPMEEVDGDAIWEGYRLAFPDNRQALAEYLTEEDEYRNW